MEYAHLAFSQGRCRKDGVAEVILCHHLRAGEREEDAALLDFLKGLLVQTGVALQRIVQRSAMLGKGRWVEDDQVVVAACTLQEFKGIFAKALWRESPGKFSSTF